MLTDVLQLYLFL